MNQETGFLDIVNERIASGKTQLPTYDATAHRIQQEIAKEDADVKEIEKLISSDQALSAEVLRVANSSFYKGLEKTFYGATEFSIIDNNDYLLTFAEQESRDNERRRFHKERKSI